MMLDDPEVLEIEEKLVDRTLEKFIAAKGKEVGIDYFLYSCLEQIHTQKAFGEGSYGGKFPPLVSYAKELDKLEEKAKSEAKEGEEPAKVVPPSSVNGLSTDTKSAISELFEFYKGKFTELSRTAALDHANAADVIPSFALLIIDLEKVITVLSKDSKIPDRKSADNEIWSHVDSLLKTLSPSYFHLMAKFIDWKYSKVEVSALDIKSIPPVGRYNRLFLKGRIKRKPKDRDRKPAPRSGGSKFDGKPRGNTGKPGGRDNFKSKDKPSDRNSANRNKPDRNRGGRPPRNKEREKERETLVIKEAESAMDKLKSNSDLREILLKPQNSFLRRIQHKHIVDAGFKSASSGENDDRAVMVLKA